MVDNIVMSVYLKNFQTMQRNSKRATRFFDVLEKDVPEKDVVFKISPLLNTWLAPAVKKRRFGHMFQVSNYD